MQTAAKMLLESIRVGRHLGGMAMRPVEKAVVQGFKAGEELMFVAARTRGVEELVGRERLTQALDSYAQVKEVASQSVASLSHESKVAALQSGARVATKTLKSCGVQARVVGPFDEHWNTIKVLEELRKLTSESPLRSRGPALRLTPRRFVSFMREVARRTKRMHQRDPVEAYVGSILSEGKLARLGFSIAPVQWEKKIYTDVARLVCFAFDQSLRLCDGSDVWGHELRVRVAKGELKEDTGVSTRSSRSRSAVNAEHVKVVVDRLLQRQDFQVPTGFREFQRQLMMNCSLMVLQLLEDLFSDQRMQIMIFGHALRMRLDPLPMACLMEELAQDEENFSNDRFKVNHKAIDEMVEALLEDDEVQYLLVPDALEAEVYRYALLSTVSIAQFIAEQLHVRLFGVEVRMSLTPEVESQGEMDSCEIRVTENELQMLLDRLSAEQKRIERELHFREEAVDVQTGADASGTDGQTEGQGSEGEAMEDEFFALASQDKLSRSLHIQRTLKVPIELAYMMVADFDAYPLWMPLCTSARSLPARGGKGPGCEVGFGIETGTMLGTVGDTVRYQVRLSPPKAVSDPHSKAKGVVRVARVVADATEGFSYGKRIIYDWQFKELASGETDISLGMFFQARNVFSLPLWDSMQAPITSAMMKKFMARAAELQGLDPTAAYGGPAAAASADAPASPGWPPAAATGAAAGRQQTELPSSVQARERAGG